MASIDFLPKRLNDPPVVFRGMTMREAGFLVLVAVIVWLIPGIVVAVIMGMPAMAPTVAAIGTGITMWFGGSIMRRLRRGRPASLLYRQFLWLMATKGLAIGREKLIVRSGIYRVGRQPSGFGGAR